MVDHDRTSPTDQRTAGPAWAGGFGSRAAHWIARRGLGPAFSLIELVLVLAILATVAAVAAPRYAEAVARYRANAAANRIVADLARAQAEARASSSARTVVFNRKSGSYKIDGSRAMDGKAGGYVVSIATEPYSAAIVGARFGDDNIIRFDGYGVPDTGGAVVVRAGGESRTVVVAPLTGAATISNVADATVLAEEK